MKVLVTGGAGFIGSHLIRGLLERNHSVRVLDNFSTGRRENIAAILNDIELLEGDIRDHELVSKAVMGVESVFHEAALPSVPRSIKDPVSSTDVNVMGTTVLLKAAVDQGVQRIVYAASSSAYGNQKELLKTETMLPAPLSPYAVTKLAGEYMLQAFSKCYPIETVGIRYFNVFGERQDPHSQYSGVIARFAKALLLGERPTIYGDGETSRDFTYVQNVVDANLLAMAAGSEVNGQVMNVACGVSITLNHLVDKLNEILGTRLEPIYVPERSGDVRHSLADTRKAQQLLGYEPRFDFETGLRRTVEWYRTALETTAV